MTALLSAAWRLVLKRAASDWEILSAAFVTILLATTLLAAGPIYGEAVALSGLRRTLDDAAVERASVEVSARLAAAEYAASDRRVASTAASAFGATGQKLYRSGRSDSFELPGGGPRRLAVLGFFSGLRSHARLVGGDWPEAGSAVAEAVLSEPAARALELAPGDSLGLTNALDGTPVEVLVTGIYRVTDGDDPFWWASQLELEGEEGSETLTYGPFVVPEQSFRSLTADGFRARWRIEPDYDDLAVAEVAPLGEAVGQLEERLNAGRGGNDRFHAETELPAVLGTVERSLLVARSGVLIPSVQLAILAAWALLFTAGLLVGRRALETAVMRSRGAGAGEIAVLAAMEGTLLAVPAALAAPWLAALSLQLLNHVGPLARVGLELEPRVGLGAYLLAFGGALACVAALSLPALRAGAVRDSVTIRSRAPERGVFQRAGLDLVLLAFALLAYWQLRRYGAPLVETVQGKIGLDPFLIAAPALGLLAGAVVALRVVPAAARIGEATLGAARGVVAPLGTRQLARRPGPYARSALLLVLALAIGVFAAAYSDTWIRSQQDQADYETGADVRVEPSKRSGAVDQLGLASAYAGVEGVREASPVLTRSLEVSQAAGVAQFLALDARAAASVVAFRDDLADRPLPGLLAPLAEHRPRLASIPLDGRPQRLALTARLTVEPPPPRFDNDVFPFFGQDLRPRLAVVLEDGHGLLHRLQGGPLENDPRRIVLDLAQSFGEQVIRPDYPLRVVGIELGIYAPFRIPRAGTLTVSALETSETAEGPLTPVEVDPGRWVVGVDELPQAQARARVLRVSGPVLTLDLATGASSGFGDARSVTFTATAGRNRLPAALPALVTTSFLDETGSHVGQVVPFGGGEEERIRLTRAVRGFPTIDPSEALGIVVDLPSYLALAYVRDGSVALPSMWWLDAAPGRSGQVAARLETPPFTSTVVTDRRARARSLESDPVALGISGALSLGFIAAAVFAVVGFAVAAAVTTRERTTEFAILRSLGLSTRQVSGSLALESGITVLLSLIGGTALGVLLAWFVLPYVSLTGSGERAFPQVIVEMPWLTALWLELGLVVALLAVVAAQVRLLGHIRLAPALRAGEDR